MQHSIKTILKTASLVLAFVFAGAVYADGTMPTPAQLYFPAVNTVYGNPNGKITIVEFFDYNCGYCHQVPALFNKLIKSNSEVRIVYRDYPVLGPDSTFAARAAIAAAEQGKYVAFHDALFKTRKPLNDATISQLASTLGVDTDKLYQDLKSRSVDQQLRTTAQAANRLQLNGVPVVVIGNTPTDKNKPVKAIVLTAPSYSELQEAVNKLSSVG